MSYILDALRKSEKERQRGAVPDLMTAQDVAGDGPKRRAFWPYLIAGALILNAGVLAWWLAWHSSKPPVATQPTATQQYTAKAPDQGNRSADTGLSVVTPASTVSNASEPAPSSAQEKSAVPKPNIPAAITNAPKVDVVRKPEHEQVLTSTRKNKEDRAATNDKGPSEVSAIPQQQTPALKQSDAASQAVALPAPVKNKLYNLQELPVSIQQGLPAFAISTHLYTGDAPSRLVRINGQILREGQFLTAGLKLEEITSEGVIFSYQNYRFRVGLK